jgi:hypothetical protein
MMYFDGRLESLPLAMQEISAEINELKNEVEDLHRALDSMGAPQYGPNGKLKAGARVLYLLREPIFEKVK